MNEQRLEEDFEVDKVWAVEMKIMAKLSPSAKERLNQLYKDSLREELENWRNSVRENTGARSGAQIKGFNTAVRYYRENIDERLDQLNRKEI